MVPIPDIPGYPASMVRTLPLVAAAVLAVSACGTTDDEADDEPGTVTRADLGDEWPLTVDSVVVRCDQKEGTAMPVMVAPDDTEYGLTGFAYTHGGYAELDVDDPIWLDNPQTSAKVSIGPLKDRALERCD